MSKVPRKENKNRKRRKTKMIIIKDFKRNEDGSYNTNWIIPEDYMSVIITAGVNFLLSQGVIEVEERHEVSILEDLDENEMEKQ